MMRPPPLTGSGGGWTDLVGGIGSGHHGSGGLPCPDGHRFRAFFILINRGGHIEPPLENQVNAGVRVQALAIFGVGEPIFRGTKKQ